MMKIKDLLFVLFVILPLIGFSQDLSTVKMTNTGAMYVGSNEVDATKAVLYVKGSFLSDGINAAIVQEGITNIDGDFYQGEGNAFPVDPVTGRGTSTGKIAFTGNSVSGIRNIIGKDGNETFDRGANYIAFPEIVIATNDTIAVASRMGIDASKISLASGSTGQLLLKSEEIGENIYDASLRITGTGISSDLVEVGLVTVEREVGLYRDTVGSNTPLFPYASPFKDTQQSAYFAGNWVRKLIADENGHVSYVYGDKPSESNPAIIDYEQYIYDPYDVFKSGDGHLIRLREKDFPYQDLINSGGLGWTSGTPDDYNQNKFVFDGSPYGLPTYQEQLFAEDSISRTVTTPNGKTVYWIFGNSYTAPINVQKLIDAMTASTNVNFSSKMYFYSAGSTTYQEYVVGGSLNAIDAPIEIPSMGIVMLRVNPSTSAGASFAITKDMLAHGNTPHNKLRAPAQIYYDEVQFRISLASNEALHDVTAIGIRENASFNRDGQDLDKVLNNTGYFQLYSVSDDNRNLSANAVPNETQPVKLAFITGSSDAQFNLQASRMESLTKGEGLWLEDLLTGTFTDLYANNGFYTFNTTPNDPANRFLVHFINPVPTGIEEEEVANSGISGNGLTVYSANDKLHIMRLTDAYMGAPIRLYDTQGRMLYSAQVTQTPYQSIDLSSLPDGVYVVKIDGKTSVTAKVVK